MGQQNPTKTSCFTLPWACEGNKGGESGLVMNESKTLFLIQSKLPPSPPSLQECDLDNIQNNSK